MRIIDRLRHKDGDDTNASTVLIAGLGNPGKRYAANRHNIGFMIADHYAAEHNWNFGKMQYEAILALGRIDDMRVIVAKPQTMMNLSGRAVSGLLRFYKVPLDRLLVIYDELDLPFGKLRLREQGGAGGHNGMKSIIEKLGSNDFPRMRIGVGRPPGRMDPAAFLLRDFDASERIELDELIGDAVRAIDTFIHEGIAAAMNKHNPRT